MLLTHFYLKFLIIEEMSNLNQHISKLSNTIDRQKSEILNLK